MIIYLAQSEVDRFEPNHFDPEGDGAIGSLNPSTSTPSSEVPDAIDDVHDEDWVGKALYDSSFKRHFAYIKPELDFYRKFRLPAPTTHFIKRVYDLFLEQNSAVFAKGNCRDCQKEISYARNHTYANKIVLCRSCYLKYLEKYG